MGDSTEGSVYVNISHKQEESAHTNKKHKTISNQVLNKTMLNLLPKTRQRLTQNERERECT